MILHSSGRIDPLGLSLSYLLQVEVQLESLSLTVLRLWLCHPSRVHIGNCPSIDLTVNDFCSNTSRAGNTLGAAFSPGHGRQGSKLRSVDMSFLAHTHSMTCHLTPAVFCAKSVHLDKWFSNCSLGNPGEPQDHSSSMKTLMYRLRFGLCLRSVRWGFKEATGPVMTSLL